MVGMTSVDLSASGMDSVEDSEVAREGQTGDDDAIVSVSLELDFVLWTIGNGLQEKNGDWLEVDYGWK